eukprot:GHVL01015781.1.p1 GENE.GHVL01015781.1~~GHVL01015781.1.p1  ORF type:complete len:1001 (-),score=230.73 GHVL01015781.1:13-3015(-)
MKEKNDKMKEDCDPAPSGSPQASVDSDSDEDTANEEVDVQEPKSEQQRTFAEIRKKISGESGLRALLENGDYLAALLSKRKNPFGAPAPKKGRGKKRMAEKEEDLQLLKNAEDDLEGIQLNTRLTSQPSIIRGNLRPYQLEGLNWMIKLYETEINGILADEMGLGKTLQTISLLSYLKEFRDIHGPFLVLSPKSTLGNWMNEFAKFSPTIRTFKFHGHKEERQNMIKEYVHPDRDAFDVCITSFEIAIKEKAALQKFHWKYVIIDEAHRIKNEASKLSIAVRGFTTDFRMLITGTPLQNNLHELWALLNFLYPDVFTSAKEFDEFFDLGGNKDVKEQSAEDSENKKVEIVQLLHKVLRPFLLRRVKSEVEKEIPPKHEKHLLVNFTEMQKILYKNILSKNIDALNDRDGSGKNRLLNLVMQLRKAANHPYLFDAMEDKNLPVDGEHVITNSGKLQLLDIILKRLMRQGSKVLIFSQMTRMLDILEDYCQIRKYVYCRIDGNTTGEDRDRQIQEFNENSDYQVFLLSTRAGGLGINLASADTVVLYDSDWNPQVDLQAMDRAHRIGQKKCVVVYRLIHANSIEQKIVEKAGLKLKIDTAVIQSGRNCEKNKKLTKNELVNMIQYGADSIFKTSAEAVTDEQLDDILTRGDKIKEEFDKRIEKDTKTALDFTSDGGMNVYEFEGTDYSESRKIADRSAWLQMGQMMPVEDNKRKSRQIVKMEGKAREAKLMVPKSLRLPPMFDWQFYQKNRLEELQTKELNYQRDEHKRMRDAVPGSVDTSNALTNEERDEKERLLTEGFSDWTKKDLHNFLRGAETYGRKQLVQIANEVEGKTIEEVTNYSDVFWRRYKEINEWEKLVTRIDRGEQRINKIETVKSELAKKMSRFPAPWEQLTISNYGGNRSKTFTESCDRFLICMTHMLGYGKWLQLRNEIKKEPKFRFDWFLKTRTILDLQKRVDILFKLIEKENKEIPQQIPQDFQKKKKKKKQKKDLKAIKKKKKKI